MMVSLSAGSRDFKVLKDFKVFKVFKVPKVPALLVPAALAAQGSHALRKAAILPEVLG